MLAPYPQLETEKKHENMRSKTHSSLCFFFRKKSSNITCIITFIIFLAYLSKCVYVYVFLFFYIYIHMDTLNDFNKNSKEYALN